MTVQMVIELPGRQGAQAVVRALDTYKARLRSSIERTQRRLTGFEQRYGVSTTQFLSNMVSEDLAGGDVEYVEWAGEAKLLDGLRAELKDLEDAHYRLPWVRPRYWDALDAAIGAGQASLTNLQVDHRSPFRGLISGSLGFENGSELHFREFVDTTMDEPRVMYAYHYQDAGGALVFRYDNAVHRPSLSRPEHKHTPTGTTASIAPTLAQIIDEILETSNAADWGRCPMSPQAIASPEDLERFARELKQFNTQLAEGMSRLQGQFANLGETWRDQEHQKFAQEFVQTMRVLHHFSRSADEQIPFLMRKAARLRDYLQQH